MQKQIFIHHLYDDITNVVQDIMTYIEIILPQQACIDCYFRLYDDTLAFVDQIEKDCKSIRVRMNAPKKSICRKKYYDIELSVHYDDVMRFVQLVEEKEINTTMCYDAITLSLNDNDGDFILLDSKSIHYHSIKKLSGL